jgi:signal transduction histidine kinase
MRWRSAGMSRLTSSRWSGLVVGVILVAALTGINILLDPRVPAQYLLVLYVLPVMAVAIGWGTRLAVVTAVLSATAFHYFFVDSHFTLVLEDLSNVVGLLAFLATAVIVGRMSARLQRAALESARLSDEQSALRRVATLVAQSASPSAVFEAVTREVGLLCGADLARMERYEDDGTVTGVAVWNTVPTQLAVGTRFSLVGPSIARQVQETGGPVRVASFAGAKGAIAQEALGAGIRSSVGCPITVAGHLWGVIAASTRSPNPFPANTESQIARFTELVATAVANAESRAELAASRGRVVAAADETRRRLERNLHDGIQQRLVSLTLRLRLVGDAVPAELPALHDELDQVIDELTEAQEEIRELSRGLHPPALTRGGLQPALRAVSRRSAIPVDVRVHSENRYPATVEVAAYYVVSEALTNSIRHAAASHVDVVVEERQRTLRVWVRDDGVGGADPRRGSGLTGLRDRIEALSGSIEVTSPAGEGTTIEVSLPIEPPEGDGTRSSRAGRSANV